MGKLREYRCINCNSVFQSDKGCVSRTPKYCSRKCAAQFNLQNKDTIKKMSDAKIGKTAWNKGVKMWENKEHPRGTLGLKFPERSGEKSHLWKGGTSTENDKIRKSAEYKKWRNDVFKRDDYTCQICNQKDKKLHADHIKPFSHFKELRLDINNGRTLCENCHFKTDSYGSKSIKYGVQKVI